MGVADFKSIAQRVGTDVLRNDVRNMPSQIAAALRWSQTNLLKSIDFDIWSAKNVLPLVDGVRAKKEAHRLRIETVVAIMKNLIEVVSTEQQLIGYFRSQRRIKYAGVIADVDGCNFEVVSKVGACRTKRGTATKRRNLIALAEISA